MNSVLNQGKSPITALFNSTEVLSSVSDKEKLFAENSSKNSNLDDSGISLPVFPSETNLKLHHISVTLKMFKRSLAFQIVGRFHQWSLYLRILENGIQLKTTTLLVFFLWLVKSLKNL